MRDRSANEAGILVGALVRRGIREALVDKHSRRIGDFVNIYEAPTVTTSEASFRHEVKFVFDGTSELPSAAFSAM